MVAVRRCLTRLALALLLVGATASAFADDTAWLSIVVESVDADGPADRAGLRSGDRLLRVNDQARPTLLQVVITEHAGALLAPRRYLVERDGERHRITIPLEEACWEFGPNWSAEVRQAWQATTEPNPGRAPSDLDGVARALQRVSDRPDVAPHADAIAYEWWRAARRLWEEGRIDEMQQVADRFVARIDAAGARPAWSR